MGYLIAALASLLAPLSALADDLQFAAADAADAADTASAASEATTAQADNLTLQTSEESRKRKRSLVSLEAGANLFNPAYVSLRSERIFPQGPAEINFDLEASMGFGWFPVPRFSIGASKFLTDHLFLRLNLGCLLYGWDPAVLTGGLAVGYEIPIANHVSLAVTLADQIIPLMTKDEYDHESLLLWNAVQLGVAVNFF